MREDPDVRAITEAINRIDGFGTLGRNRLARGSLLDAELNRIGLDDTPFQRGRLLSRLIREEVRRQFEEREANPEGRDVAEWSILYSRVHSGLSLQEIGERLNMPGRSVARYYARAKELLLDRLYTLEENVVQAGIHCPLCGSTLCDSSQNTLTSGACTVCDAEVSISLGDEGIIRMTARKGYKLGSRTNGEELDSAQQHLYS